MGDIAVVVGEPMGRTRCVVLAFRRCFRMPVQASPTRTGRCTPKTTLGHVCMFRMLGTHRLLEHRGIALVNAARVVELGEHLAPLHLRVEHMHLGLLLQKGLTHEHLSEGETARLPKTEKKQSLRAWGLAKFCVSGSSSHFSVQADVS